MTKLPKIEDLRKNSLPEKFLQINKWISRFKKSVYTPTIRPLRENVYNKAEIIVFQETEDDFEDNEGPSKGIRLEFVTLDETKVKSH